MRYAIGIDLGGTFIKYAIVDEEGNFLHEGKLPSKAEESQEAVVGELKRAAAECVEQARAMQIELCGIGVGTPGITDERNRVVLGGAENIVGWEQVALSDQLEEAFGLPTAVANDANMMGLAEQAFGAAKGCSDVLFITVGTGIGGALVINNKLYGGYKNRGTEIGHIPLIANGEPCACGSVGCLETYASTTALVKRFERRCEARGVVLSEEADGKLIVDLYHAKDPVAVESLDEHWDFLGHGIAGLVNIFSPERVVIGGGISEAGSFYIERIEQAMIRYAIPDCRVNTQVCAAGLGNKAGTMGAAQLAFSL